MPAKRNTSDSYRKRSGSAAGGALSQKTVLVAESEAGKPIGVRADDGEFVTLLQFQDRPELREELVQLESLPYEKQAEFTIKRLRSTPPDLRVRIVGQNVFSRDAIILEVEKGSPTGKRFVQIERIWVERLKEKISKGEYKVRVQAQASADAV